MDQKNINECNFCLNPNSILERDTCCSGCSKIPNPYPIQYNKQKKRKKLANKEEKN